MDICTSGHDEIVHNERKCPLCWAMDEIKNQEARNKELESEIETLGLEIDNVKNLIKENPS